MAVDRRVRRTREAIHRALVTLMLEKGYDAVTVAEIIERADIGRSTFYTHYTDKQHVLYTTLDAVADFLRAQRDASGGRLFGFSRALFEHVHEQRELLRALLGRRGGTVVHNRIRQVLVDLVREDLESRARPDAVVPIEIAVDSVVGSYLALLGRWADDREPYPPQQMDAVFRQLVIPGIAASLGITAAPDDSPSKAPKDCSGLPERA
ncbi:TetR/AcrR family transcriptional regulator [Micromonospora costi]|uniref:TetR/AcrR family transcriptional regulator n=2 Tax=Micromonospora costi TaxID=1530042 RepID=A0A3A9ZXX4_9ACTN|nr:TetR/AcrR family transcriptional regulator [Micromonospora costi]